MDLQLKKGLIEICVLRVLLDNDSYGYKIIKDVQPYIEISESTLYPILKRLEFSNALEVYSIEHNGRLRKYYKITDKGKEKIYDFLLQWESIQKLYEFIREINNE